MGNMQKRITLLIALFAVTLAGVQAASRLRETRHRMPDWSAVPYDLDDWQGKDTTFDPVYGADPADTSLLRVYSRGADSPVILYVGFYRDLTTSLDVHTPEICYPAQGWTISTVNLSHNGVFRRQPIPAKEIVADKTGIKRLVTWWNQAGSQPFETRIRYVYAMLAMSLFTGRTDGSLVRIETPIEADGEAAANARVGEFCKSLLPRLEKALP
jgi:EpsI family protein